MDFAIEPSLLELADEARALGRAGAHRRTCREDGWLVGHDPEFALEVAARGWLGMTWPEAVGGGGRSALERFVVFEALISEGAPLASCYFADRQIGPTLLAFGTPEQQALWLPGILAGTDTWCIGMSEPDAGSDVASLTTRAVRDRDAGAGHGELVDGLETAIDGAGWRVTGRKVWTSGAQHADWCYLIARTDPDAPKHAGLSELVVDMRSPGIDVRPIVDAVGDGHFCEVTFDDVRVPADHLVGEENGSFRQVMRQMEHERGGIDRLVSNHRLYLDCVDGMTDEQRADPVLRQELAHLETGYRLGRLLVLREVLGQAPKQFSAAAKTACTEHEQRVAAFCARLLGPAAQAWSPLVAPPTGTEPPAGPEPPENRWTTGHADDLPSRVARGQVYAPAYTLMGGTTQILRTIVADRLLALPRA